MTQVAVVLYIVAKIGNYFSTLGLGYTGQLGVTPVVKPSYKCSVSAKQRSEPVVLLQLCS